MDRHKKQFIDVWARLTPAERNYCLKQQRRWRNHKTTLALLPLVEIEPVLAAIIYSRNHLDHKKDRRRFINKLIRKLT